MQTSDNPGRRYLGSPVSCPVSGSMPKSHDGDTALQILDVVFSPFAPNKAQTMPILQPVRIRTVSHHIVLRDLRRYRTLLWRRICGIKQGYLCLLTQPFCQKLIPVNDVVSYQIHISAIRPKGILTAAGGDTVPTQILPLQFSLDLLDCHAVMRKKFMGILSHIDPSFHSGSSLQAKMLFLIQVYGQFGYFPTSH